MAQSVTKQVIQHAQRLSEQVDALEFQKPVAWVYNPLNYAWAAHKRYLERYARPTCRVVFLGMNPGPFGMAQTGVPFGEIPAVRDWLGIELPVNQPSRVHPKRPVDGFQCAKSEVSGRRLWGLFAERFENADAFFEEHFVANYCPLVFMDEGGRNVTPDKIERNDAAQLEAICDEHLGCLLTSLRPEYVVGVGAYAENCLKRVVKNRSELADSAVVISKILHPSPASPAANRDWAGQATKQLLESGVWA